MEHQIPDFIRSKDRIITTQPDFFCFTSKDYSDTTTSLVFFSFFLFLHLLLPPSLLVINKHMRYLQHQLRNPLSFLSWDSVALMTFPILPQSSSLSSLDHKANPLQQSTFLSSEPALLLTILVLTKEVITSVNSTKSTCSLCILMWICNYHSIIYHIYEVWNKYGL